MNNIIRFLNRRFVPIVHVGTEKRSYTSNFQGGGFYTAHVYLIERKGRTIKITAKITGRKKYILESGEELHIRSSQGEIITILERLLWDNVY